ncbi:ABC-type multidrug transport system fused ATPase/permease subunit [Dyadobacter sp. BE34]|uniref:ABC-type multidrug transport system fused ATPase/permease subunit n=1 Tax=Dyadobacter fermentans TaxID=94254 RepID=A0ABU1R329_9BACT|nr:MULTISPECIES: ABC transporter ATP-binding protein [Dyadobacter]MDR6807365.1 ABC-type multidrug transport system fused ATPase/permease subunit [Dyadobacter fermentans]MDR7045106.1 ABC-type multidrug transport system fused ATPase/permease subunit [Dyadobacter sp. BE242]MDR7199158.1 ABC-type multidrug transport system fused ATPase/permease subunit [Dyadobacter sp. BE34]MDR7217118.1 ABC-type multidrug transport system fused ATPase/permease subunit [Dyadobacter sp. BE31]MDR7265051.1 ABC-type mul
MNIWQIFQRLHPFVQPYHRQIAFALFLTLLGAITAQVNPWVLRYTVDTVQSMLDKHWGILQGKELLLQITAILFVKEIVNTFIVFGQRYFGEKIRIKVSSDLAQNAVNRILTYNLAFFSDNENQKGKLQTRIDRGAESLTKLIQNFFIDILPLFANAVVALGIMFSANFYVGCIALAILPVYFWVSYKQAGELQGVRRKLKRQRENKSNGLINLIESVIVIKSFVREKLEGEKQYRLQMELMDSQLKTRKTNFTYDGIKSFIEQIGVVLIIILTAYLVLNQQMSIGAIMFHILLFNNVSAPIRQLHRIYDEMNDALTYSEGFFDILDASSSVETSGETVKPQFQGDYQLRNVSFAYPNGTKALSGINMEIKSGQTTALVGLSGAGKSTLINLLVGFYAQDTGEILLDGKPLKSYDLSSLRNAIGMVLQKNHIFKGSIAENIWYGKPDATRDELVDASKSAYLHEQIMELPNGYETDAQLLSGGQQQRIAIARLFLKNPPIIFLDEPTASLDAIATEQIKNSLDAIKKNRTVVIISHSLAQILDSDQIYVMKKGQIVESGKHEDLYEQNGVYRQIFNASARSLNLGKMLETMGRDQA